MPEVATAFIERYNRSVDEIARKTPVHVFIMGPAQDNKDAVYAADLRRELIERCKAKGYSAYAEHPEIVEVVRNRLGDQTDLCTIELLYANQVDVLVFIPASHGSAAEIGYFAGLEGRSSGASSSNPPLGICSLVLLEASRKDEGGFVIDGPAKVLSENGSRIEFVNYADIESAWGIVDEVIGKAQRMKIRRGAR